MPGIRRANIEQEFANGLRYSSRWRVTELKLSGGKAKARLRGTSTDVRNGVAVSSRAVDEEIVLVKKGKAWKLDKIAQ